MANSPLPHSDKGPEKDNEVEISIPTEEEMIAITQKWKPDSTEPLSYRETWLLKYGGKSLLL